MRATAIELRERRSRAVPPRLLDAASVRNDEGAVAFRIMAARDDALEIPPARGDLMYS